MDGAVPITELFSYKHISHIVMKQISDILCNYLKQMAANVPHYYKRTYMGDDVMGVLPITLCTYILQWRMSYCVYMCASVCVCVHGKKSVMNIDLTSTPSGWQPIFRSSIAACTCIHVHHNNCTLFKRIIPLLSFMPKFERSSFIHRLFVLWSCV